MLRYFPDKMGFVSKVWNFHEFSLKGRVFDGDITHLKFNATTLHSEFSYCSNDAHLLRTNYVMALIIESQISAQNLPILIATANI